jgi:formate dehydrogenase accessory protein FdhD
MVVQLRWTWTAIIPTHHTPAPSSPQQIFSLVDEFLTKQPPHSESGGVHTSALADHGHIHLLLHDIGRHNSFDKIAGFILLEKIRLENPAILTSGRASSDMLQKTIRMQIPYLITMRSTSRTGLNWRKSGVSHSSAEHGEGGLPSCTSRTD